MKVRVLVRVVQRYIRHKNRYSSIRNPIVLAVKAVLKTEISVFRPKDGGLFGIDTESGKRISIDILRGVPKNSRGEITNIKDWLFAFNEGMPVEPFEFYIRVPKSWLCHHIVPAVYEEHYELRPGLIIKTVTIDGNNLPSHGQKYFPSPRLPSIPKYKEPVIESTVKVFTFA